MNSLLLCAAVEDELAALSPWLRRDGTMLCGKIGKWEVRAAPIGVGPVDAALGAARALGQGADAAILLGTCGAFPGSGIRVGEAVIVERSILTSSDAATGASYIPPLAATPSHGDPALIQLLMQVLDLPRVACATVAAITSGASHAAALAAATGCQVEHMEAHAFLRAAEQAKVPAACLLGVANEVGPEAHEQWKANAAAASTAAIEALRRFGEGWVPQGGKPA